MRHLRAGQWMSMVVAAAAGAGGCAAGPRAGPGALPPDFVLGVTVMTPPGEPVGEGPTPARHVMEADWVLRTLVGAGVTPAVFPPRTRQLRREEVVSLWGMMEEAGLTRPDHPAGIGGWPADRPPPMTPVYVVEFTAQGEHRVLAIDAEGEGGAGARALAGRLAELAWVR